MSVTFFCSGSRSMTGCGVAGSNSLELAPSRPHTCRANSITAHCRPRQMPRNGTRFSRANRTAATLPSTPRTPNPPGIRMPSTSGRALLRSPIRRGRPRRPTRSGRRRRGANPPCFKRLHHGQVGVAQVHVLPDDRDRAPARSPASIRSTSASHSVRSGSASIRRWRASSASRPSLCSDERDLVDRRRVDRADHAADRHVAEQRDLLLEVAADRAVATGTRSRRAGGRASAAPSRSAAWAWSSARRRGR